MLKVYPGTYTERIRTTASGTPTAPIVIEAVARHMAVIDGTNILVPQNGYEALLELSNVSPVVLRGLKVQDSSYVGINVIGPASGGVTVERCFTERTASSGIAAWGLVDGGPSLSDLRIEGCEIAHANLSCWHENLILNWGVHDFIVKNNLVRDGGPGNPNGDSGIVIAPEGIDAKFGVANGRIVDSLTAPWVPIPNPAHPPSIEPLCATPCPSTSRTARAHAVPPPRSGPSSWTAEAPRIGGRNVGTRVARGVRLRGVRRSRAAVFAAALRRFHSESRPVHVTRRSGQPKRSTVLHCPYDLSSRCPTSAVLSCS